MFAQVPPLSQRDRSGWSNGGETSQIYFEAVNLIADEAGKHRLDIHYRISYDFFVFVRNTDTGARFPYIARADIAVEILDSNKISVARQIVHKELHSAEIPTQQSEKKFLQGIFSFTLFPGRYTIVTEVNDLESLRKYFDDTRVIMLADDQARSLFLSDIVFAEAVAERDSFTRFVPLNYGGDVPFGQNFDVYAELRSRLPLDSLRCSYHIKSRNSEIEEPTTIMSDSNLVEMMLPARSLLIQNGEMNYVYHVSGSSREDKYLIAFHVQGDTLEQGMYELNLSLSSAIDSVQVKKQFHIRWLSMPQSLRSFERAIEPLKHIVEEKEFRKLKNAPRRDRKKKFDEFWKSKDPTPKTAFNEAMAEFYRRVDYASTNFSTLRTPDGVETDRGKAYILYGPPTKIDRTLSPGNPPQEIWYYTNLSKKLIFLDETGKGDYKFMLQEQL